MEVGESITRWSTTTPFDFTWNINFLKYFLKGVTKVLTLPAVSTFTLLIFVPHHPIHMTNSYFDSSRLMALFPTIPCLRWRWRHTGAVASFSPTLSAWDTTWGMSRPSSKLTGYTTDPGTPSEPEWFLCSWTISRSTGKSRCPCRWAAVPAQAGQIVFVAIVSSWGGLMDLSLSHTGSQWEYCRLVGVHRESGHCFAGIFFIPDSSSWTVDNHDNNTCTVLSRFK